MSQPSIGALIDQWMAIYEDHQSMVEQPEDQWHLLNTLIMQMFETGEMDDSLGGEFLNKAAAAYQWALEFKACQVCSDNRP